MGNSQLLELQNPSKTQIKDYSQYSDEELMYLCQKYGTQTILWRQRFIGLLPEVNRRKLYEKKGIDVNETILKMLEKREEEIVEQKEVTMRKVTDREEKRRSEGKKPVRQISVKVKRTHTAQSLPCEVRWRSQPLLKEEYGTKCAVNGCDKAAEHLHHTVPFAMKNPALTHGVSSPSSCLRQVRAPRGKPSSTGSRPWFSVSRVINASNAPDLLKPLCREHHDILHTINSNYVSRKWG